ncbi:PKD domain-containing protein [Pelomonas sp. SE-A7]|uniref:PKD domain-containing protein n=1 Tax=Pelomonas sp. SE-A7 TaxID=3054953 RepID=UPI00259CA1CE|nr:PKD domain-containing protein [Pelomonas sp. SE-A7]MDM4764465.1 PKD domain-containing protein [Pelomonas sp. SE-A7]
MKKILAGMAAILAVVLAACGGSSDPAAPAASVTPTNPNALFQVGAASVSIAPQTPVFAGGSSDKAKPAIQLSNDPLEVRAFVVAKGDKAVAFAVVDSTGWFAEYQGAEAGYGQFGARVDAAQKLVDRGFKVDRSAVLVSTTHSHATPTVVGIWGLMGPENRAYVKLVHDAVVKAVDQAAANLKTSELWVANGDIAAMVWQNGQGTNHPDGFGVDSRLPILWARDPATGATNALHVSVPTHPDQFRPFNGTVVQGYSADTPGYVRKQLDSAFGGTAVVGSGTLGRQEPPGQNPDYAEVAYQGEYLVNAVHLAMAKAQPLKADTLASAEMLIPNITVGSSAGNQGLLSLMKYNASNGPFGGPNCNAALGGNCSIPRALAAPWCVGNCSVSGSGATTMGTYVTALRIGPLMYVSNPGESFPEVNDAIRNAVLDAQSVNAVGTAGDFLGYNWAAGDYSTAQIGSADFLKYNVGPDLGQLIADAGYATASALGFKVKSAKELVKAQFDSSVPDLPGLQYYSTKLASMAGSISFYASTGQPQSNWQKPAHALSQIVWDFGDGSASVASDSAQRLSHAFTTPGAFKVTARVTDNTTGKSRAWSQTLTIHAPLLLNVSSAVEKGDINRTRLTLNATGGQGTLLAVRWSCPDGTKPEGLSVTCSSLSGGRVVSVTAWDGAGNSATAQGQLQ